MDMLYYKQPIFLLFPIALLSWQIVVCCLKKKKSFSSAIDLILSGAGVTAHAAAITVILMNSGTLSDALLLVLLSGALSLFLSPKPNVKEDKGEGENN